VAFELRARRGLYLETEDCLREGLELPADESMAFEELDLIHCSLVALLHNRVATSGHPGGSISSGRFSDCGREATPHPYRFGHFPGSRQRAAVLREAGLDGKSPYEAMREFSDLLVRQR
jgi:hypothetical protein